jgi:hypothetical protein
LALSSVSLTLVVLSLTHAKTRIEGQQSMNDPGLDEPISNDAKDVENQVNDERDEKEEDEQAFLEPRQVFFTGDSLHNVQTCTRYYRAASVPLFLRIACQDDRGI